MNIKIGLSIDSIDAAIKQLELYQNSLDAKLETFVTELANAGMNAGRAVLSTIHPADLENTTIDFVEPVLTHDGDGIVGALIQLEGEKVAFIEFSAGIYFGTDSYPLPSGDPYGMGTYPGAGHWDDENGWTYMGNDGKFHHTYGNKAYMPMYETASRMKSDMANIAARIFRT